ncbi:MAG: DNA polymerase I [Alphaproteobacteria bacterium GM202ARS2]|nr:DNA polymerase I [Alphaproteobacteria bacterium GM202ARS2]
MDKLILVDGSGYIFRAFYALPMMNRSDGLPVNAIYGFTRMLLNIVENEQSLPGNENISVGIGIIFDCKRQNFRNDIYADYKANRQEPPKELIPQFDWIKKVPQAFNLVAMEKEGFEADDIIATYARLARKQNVPVTVYSSDKDLMQLVGDGLVLFDPVKNQEVGVQGVINKFGVVPEKVLDVMALAGDSSDNIPGVPGIGVKTAAQLIDTFGDLDTLLAQAGDAIKQPKRREALVDYADQARLSRELARLKDDVKLDNDLSTFAFKPLDVTRLLTFLQTLEFSRIITEVKERFHSPLTQDSIFQQGQLDFPADTGESANPSDSSTFKVETLDADAPAQALQTWVTQAQARGLCSLLWVEENDTTPASLLLGLPPAVNNGQATCVLMTIPADKPPHNLKWWSALQALWVDNTVRKVVHDIKAWHKRLNLKVDEEGGLGGLVACEDIMLLAYSAEGGHLQHDWLSIWRRMHLSLGLGDVSTSEEPTYQAMALLKIYQHLCSLAIERGVYALYRTVERPLVEVLARMERTGMAIDRAYLGKLSDDFAERQQTIESSIFEDVGHEFAIGSSQQLARVLFEELNLPAGKRGKSGAYSTDSSVLDDLSAQGHLLADKVLGWRRLAKLRNTYTEALPRYVDDEGRVHSHFAQTVANTGRLSSAEPNVQNIPIRREEGQAIRRAFTADKGWCVLSADYSQIELRLLAHIADVTALKQAFADGVDIHRRTAADIFAMKEADVDKDKRRRAKAINFGIIYGISAFGLARQLKIDQSDAQVAIDAFFRVYPQVKTYMHDTIEQCRQNGYVQTLFGRRCFMPSIKDPNAARRHFAERAAINAPIQGSAADLMKRAMIRIDDKLRTPQTDCRMLLQVHDELVFEVKRAAVDEWAKTIATIMEQAHLPAKPMDVALVVDTGWGDNWAEAH